MYTIHGTLEEVGAFLQGFYSGMGAHTKSSPAQREAQHWFAFCTWAVDQLQAGEKGSWHRLFVLLRVQFGTDAEALDKVFDLYIKFYRQTQEELNP
jgi:hypothetical protein